MKQHPEGARVEGRGSRYEVRHLRLGEDAIGVPVVNRQGRPLGAIHIAGSLSEWSAEDFARRAAPIAQEAARAISGSF